MTDDAAYVRNINGAEVAPTGDSFVYFLPLEKVDALEALVVDGEDVEDFLDDYATRSISIGRLLGIAISAIAVLESEAGVLSMAELATAVEAAGFAPNGTYTDTYGETPETQS